MKGYFISFEGPDGAGKTTIINELVQQLSSKTIAPILVTREPGG
ncbi:MAG: dTMP kinase, partial [Lactobacillus iners]|nr:dTMP kinase [Lactobacillus iners]